MHAIIMVNEVYIDNYACLNNAHFLGFSSSKELGKAEYTTFNPLPSFVVEVV
jgi:hypothetical protein